MAHLQLVDKNTKSLEVHGLDSDESILFHAETAPIFAVAYCYCMGSGLSRAFIAAWHSGYLDEFYKTLPIVASKYSISCGDYAAKLES